MTDTLPNFTPEEKIQSAIVNAIEEAIQQMGAIETEHTETVEKINERTCFSQYVKKSNDENRRRKIKDIKIW